MKKIALGTIYLYFFICPLEFIFNARFGSSEKYIALVAGLFTLIYFLTENDRNLKITTSHFCLLGWLLLEALSVLWTLQSSVTYDRVITYFMMVAFVVLLSLSAFEEKEIDRLLMFYSLGCLILSVIILVKGDMDGDVNQAGRLTIKVLGRFQDPNAVAANILAGAFYALDKAFKNKKFIVLYLASFAVQVATIFYSGSRGGLVALAVALLAFVLIKIPKKRWLVAIICFAAVAVSAYLILKYTLPEKLYLRLFDFANYKNGTGRLNTWSIALPSIAEHPLFGRGVASYLTYFLYEKGVATAMHNTFLAIIFEVGFVGFILFMVPYAKSLKSAVTSRNAFVVAVILGNLTTAFFLDALYFRYVWNVMIFGLMYLNLENSRSVKAAENGLIKEKA